MKKYISILFISILLLTALTFSTSASNSIVSDEGRLPFEDVREDYWFYDGAEFCYGNGIVKGMNEYTFGRNGGLTRAQFVTMLAGLEGVDTSAYTADVFCDVKESHWFYSAVAWAYDNDVINGMTEDSFEPNGVLTRAQLAAVMKNYMNGKYEVELKDDAFDKFTDKPKSEYWYYDAMKYAVSAELLSGNSDGTLAPTGTVTRAQAVVMLKSFAEKYFYGSCEHTFTEADCTNAATCQSCGMVNGLPKGHCMPLTYNCKTAQVCFVCNAKVEPSNIHDFAPANCGNPRTCKVCGLTRGEATGDHKELWAATCTKGAMCKTCYHTVSKPLGHTTSNGICSRCRTANFTNMYDRTVHHIKSEGTYDPQTNSYSYLLTRGTLFINHGYYSVSFDFYSYVVYHIATDSIEISNIRSNSWHDDIEISAILVNRYDTKCQLAYSQYDSKGKLQRYATGFVNKTNYTKGALPSFSNYDLGGEDIYTVRYSCGQNLDLALDNLHYELNEYYSGGLSDIGFTNYKPYTD